MHCIPRTCTTFAQLRTVFIQCDAGRCSCSSRLKYGIGSRATKICLLLPNERMEWYGLLSRVHLGGVLRQAQEPSRIPIKAHPLRYCDVIPYPTRVLRLRYTVSPRRERVVKVNCLQFNGEHTYSQVVLVVSVAIKLSLMLPLFSPTFSQPPTHVPFPLHHHNEPPAPSFMCTFVPFCRVCRLRLLLAYISRTEWAFSSWHIQNFVPT